MPKVKTHSLLAVVKSHERSNKVFGERFMNSIRSDCEDAIANNFLGVGVEVARYTLTCTSGENSDLNPSFWGFRKVISCSEERGQVGHGCMYIIQVEATWEGEAWIMWSSVGGRVEAGGLRVLEFKIQGCSEVVEGGGGRRARR